MPHPAYLPGPTNGLSVVPHPDTFVHPAVLTHKYATPRPADFRPRGRSTDPSYCAASPRRSLAHKSTSWARVLSVPNFMCPPKTATVRHAPPVDTHAGGVRDRWPSGFVAAGGQRRCAPPTPLEKMCGTGARCACGYALPAQQAPSKERKKDYAKEAYVKEEKQCTGKPALRSPPYPGQEGRQTRAATCHRSDSQRSEERERVASPAPTGPNPPPPAAKPPTVRPPRAPPKPAIPPSPSERPGTAEGSPIGSSNCRGSQIGGAVISWGTGSVPPPVRDAAIPPTPQLCLPRGNL
jgi:hypothetical protein